MRPHHAAALLLMVLWGASLFLPAFRAAGSVSMGWQLLAFGWLGVLVGQLDWIGNRALVLLVVLLIAGRRQAGSFAALGFALGIILVLSLARNRVMTDESGNDHAIEARFVGWGLWIASIGLGAIVASIGAVWPGRLALRSVVR